MKFLASVYSVWQMICTATQGTPPIQVTSTTKVANLNCDLFDDQDGPYYLNYNNHANTPTKLSQFTNDIGAGGGVKITTATTAPTTPSPGDFWYKQL